MIMAKSIKITLPIYPIGLTISIAQSDAQFLRDIKSHWDES